MLPANHGLACGGRTGVYGEGVWVLGVWEGGDPGRPGFLALGARHKVDMRVCIITGYIGRIPTQQCCACPHIEINM